MASRDVYDLLILHGPDAKEWCQYLFSLFQTHPEGRDFAIDSYELNENEPIQRKNLKTFQNSKCILILLSGDLESNFDNPDVLQSLRTVLRPPHKIIVLFCGVMDKEDFTYIFQDWPHWKQLSSEDEPELYVIRVKDTILDDSGCESGTEPEHPQDQSHPEAIQGNLLSIQPERIRCGVKTEIYLIFKCKLDSGIKNEVHFNPLNGPCVRSPATLQNEYILSVDAPDLPSGLVFLKVFSGDLPICDAKITYFTDMEEICQLLDNATNPVEFMCQAFKIMPYNREALDKLLTESLKNNIPASGLHLFGINQIEEENTIANQRDEELPTLLHFSAKYGLKNLTALLLTCPGALQAYSVSNKHGDFPNNIAEKYGFKDLRQFIDEYVETADMLKTHIKEELMQGDNDDSLYETMVNLSTDILMKCSLHPGSDEDLYETMVGFADDTYIDMRQLESHEPTLETQGLTAQDSMLRKILEGSSLGIYDKEYGNDMKNTYQECSNEDYDTVGSATSSLTTLPCRPPKPIPRPENPIETEPFISQVFGRNMPVPRNENIYMESFRSRTTSSVKLKRDRQQSSVYDPFAGMKTPGQRELITLQERVKLGMISVDEAVLEFKEWQLNQKRRSDSFRYQQENLRRLRDSINRRRDENKKTKNSDIEITRPIPRGKNRRAVQDYGIYEQASSLVSSQVEISRGNWKTDSTSSTASSNSNRSSTRSTLSLSSGREGDNEEELPDELPEERPRYSPWHASLQEETPPPRPPRPPRIQNHSTRRSKMSSSGHSCRAPPVPPRGNN